MFIIIILEFRATWVSQRSQQSHFFAYPSRFYCPTEDVSGLFLSCSAAGLIKSKRLLNLSSAWHSWWRKENRRASSAEESTTSNWGSLALHLNHHFFPLILHHQIWSLQEGSPLKMIAGIWENFRLFQTLLVKIYDHSNRANIHRGGEFLLLLLNANGFQAQCRENCWDGETAASEDFMLINFPLTCRFRVSELLLLLFMILHEQIHTFKHV